MEFIEAGCTPVLDGNLEVLKSHIGDSDFCREYGMKLADKQQELLTFLAELGDGQVSHYLLRCCVNGSRMTWRARLRLLRPFWRPRLLTRASVRRSRRPRRWCCPTISRAEFLSRFALEDLACGHW